MRVYDYSIFLENGTREGFYLEYGPENEKGGAVRIDWRTDPYIARFNEETNGLAYKGFENMENEAGIAIILVNQPRELED